MNYVRFLIFICLVGLASSNAESGLVSILAPDGSGGTVVVTESFTPGSGFSAPVLYDALASMSSPGVFGGFSFDLLTGLASYLAPTSFGGLSYLSASVPEPSSLLLTLTGAWLTGAFGRRKRTRR